MKANRIEKPENLEVRAERYIQELSKDNYILGDNFPFGLALCLKEIAKSGNKGLFKRLVDSFVEYSERINQGVDAPVKLEALDFIEFQCIVGDTGRMGLGIPIPYQMGGPARKMFLDIYHGQLARDKDYTPTHSIKL